MKTSVVQRMFSFLIVFTFLFVLFREGGEFGPKPLSSAPTPSAVLSSHDVARMYSELGGEPGTKPVIVFSASWCSVCRALEAQLEGRGIEFLRADIENNRDAYRYFRTLVGSGPSAVPLTVVGTKTIPGYQLERILVEIQALLGESLGAPKEGSEAVVGVSI